MLTSRRTPNSPMPVGCGGAVMRTAISAGGSPVKRRWDQPGAVLGRMQTPSRNLPGLGQAGQTAPCCLLLVAATRPVDGAPLGITTTKASGGPALGTA